MERHQLPEELRDKLEDFETQYGDAAGKLALAMDLMTDAEIAAANLRIYCRSALDARRGHPDLESVITHLAAVKMLVREAFHSDRDKRRQSQQQGPQQ